jgi:hypothetical protein
MSDFNARRVEAAARAAHDHSVSEGYHAPSWEALDDKSKALLKRILTAALAAADSVVLFSGERDFETHPYDVQEKRAVAYILQMTGNQVGAGDDPIGFLIASHNYLRMKQS